MSQGGGQRGGGAKGNNGKQPSMQRGGKGPKINQGQGKPQGNQAKKQGVPRGPNTNQHLGGPRLPNPFQFQEQSCGSQQRFPRGPHPNHFQGQPRGNQEGCQRIPNLNQCQGQPCGMQQGGPRGPNPIQFPKQPPGNQQGGPRGPNPKPFPGQPQGNQQGGPSWCTGQPQGKQGSQRGPNPNQFPGQPQGNQHGGPRRQNPNQCLAQPQGNQQGGPRRPNPNQFPGQPQGNQQGGPRRPNPNQFPGQPQGNQQGGPRRQNPNQFPAQPQGNQQGCPRRPNPNQFPGQPQGNQQGGPRRQNRNQCPAQPQGNQQGGPKRPIPNQFPGQPQGNQQGNAQRPIPNHFIQQPQETNQEVLMESAKIVHKDQFKIKENLSQKSKDVQQSPVESTPICRRMYMCQYLLLCLTQTPQPQVLLSGPVSQTGINIQKGDGQQDHDDNRSKASLRRRLRRVCSHGDGKDKVGQHDNEEQNVKIPDVDDTEVFKFLIKHFGGGCSYEDFLRRCDLFPLNSNIMLWFRKHNRRFHIFWDKKDIVCLQPFYRDAKICVQWNSKKNPGECQNAHWDYFHICRRFIRGNCKDKDCPLSHSFRSPHNYRLQNKLGIGDFSDDEMKIVLNCNSPSVCADYIYKNGCKVDNPERRCPHLHLCRQKIFGKCPDPCKFNRTHTINQFHNKWVLTSCHMKGWPPAKVLRAIYVPLREKKENVNYSDDSDLSQDEEDLHDLEESSVFDYDSDVYVSSESLSSSASGPAKNKIVHSVENLSIDYNKEGTRSKHGRKERFRSLENITCGIVGKDDQDLTESSDDYDDKDDYGGGNVDDDDDYGDSKVDKDNFCDGNVDDDDDDYGDGNDDGDDDDYSDGNDEDYYGDRNVEIDPRAKEMIMTEDQTQIQQGNGDDNELDDGCDFGYNDDYQDNYVNDYHENDGNDYYENDGNDYDDNKGGDYDHDYGDYDFENDAEDNDNEYGDDNGPYDDGHGDDNKIIEIEKLTMEKREQDQHVCGDDNIKKYQQDRNKDIDNIKEKEEEIMENWKGEKQGNDKNSKDEHQNLLDDDDIKEKERIQMEAWKKEQQQSHDDDDNIIERERLMMEQWKQQQLERSVLPYHTDVKSEPALSPSDPEYQETDSSLLKDETENTKICIKISGKWFSLSLAENEKTEKSFCDLQDVAPTEMKCEDNKYNCHIWFQKMHAVILDVNGLPAADDDQWCTVRRLTVLHSGGGIGKMMMISGLYSTSLDSIPFPSAMGTPKPAHFYNWDCSHDFEPIELDKAGKEYKDVLKSILDSMDPSKFDFKFIYRIQNRKIWSEYDIKKKHMLTDAEQDGQGQNIDERDLFHGTNSLDTCHGICTNNFDFRTSGRNATVYGEGSYFAVRARLSHSYTKADSPTDMRFLFSIFRAKVLVGKFTEGNPSLLRPPEIPGQVHKLYDSCVDNVEDPQIVVVFDRNQCYPEYIIMYTDKEPVKVEKPMVQPLMNQPLVQPLVNQPLVQPLVSQPLVQPLVYQPIVYPHNTGSQTSLQMQMGGPIVYPHPTTTTMQSSIEKPASSAENSSAHLNKHCKKEKDECVLQ
ncbi:PARP7S [Mytilus coruscus]|uniref:PARP7S n=1 Tax=Mytilus coruscus TaxID=42192 RepID=A0A6J8CCT7_MYTCO|nr:PARP7S [Mytilus coruscus]